MKPNWSSTTRVWSRIPFCKCRCLWTNWDQKMPENIREKLSEKYFCVLVTSKLCLIRCEDSHFLLPSFFNLPKLFFDKKKKTLPSISKSRTKGFFKINNYEKNVLPTFSGVWTILPQAVIDIYKYLLMLLG